jgi:hypothetical protein
VKEEKKKRISARSSNTHRTRTHAHAHTHTHASKEKGKGRTNVVAVQFSVQFEAPDSFVEGRTLRPLKQAVPLGVLEDLVDERAHGLLDVDVLLGRRREPTSKFVGLS